MEMGFLFYLKITNSFMKTYLVLLILLISTSQMAYAGGYNFNIKITNIHSLSDDKHLIYFQKLEKIGYDDYPYPLDDCQNIKIIIDYKYKESWVRRIEQFFYLLFKDTSKFDEGVNNLKQNIELLKKYQHKTFNIDDIEAFNHNPNNHCELYTKTIDIPNSDELQNEDIPSFRFILRRQDF